ncbi:CCR4-NOT transcription complex subunit 3-like isoform X2 [Pomacea canaliculata]|uniref:CCR4-NOT transcription complex subunit 3-like isoform X2 n=1 Tax=Pomacea canaliculata TaxID=400727 RepID=UPI000D739C1F|nr:CCR4-NOT transcription complex subunit 3-like isoform X2 [Pomacea canaliculata]
MADKRRLQGEIDRCLKKVDEGVEIFEDIWQKVQTATNSNQKEKYETDLKKEIKKLQRLRDQIKTWLASNDIKDKQSLTDHRKLIETQMERFKILERETKTKAYSKDGLGAAAKLDPQTKEKGEMTTWLAMQIESLQIQVDQFECELESMECSSKKKKMEKDAGPRADELKTLRDRHKYHMKQLELVMRAVDNDAVPLEQIKNIKEDIEYYVQSNQDPQFRENEFLYDDLDLEEICEPGTQAPGTSPFDADDHDKLDSNTASTNSSSPSPSPSEKIDEKERKRHKSQSEEVCGKQILYMVLKKLHTSAPLISKIQTTPSKQSSQSNSAPSQNTEANSINSNHHPLLTATPPLAAYAAAASSQQNNIVDSKPQVNSVNDHMAASNMNSSNVPASGSANPNTVSLTSSGNPSVPSAPSPHVGAVGVAASISSSSSTSGINSIQISSSRSDVPVVMNGPHSAGSHFILKNQESLSSLQSIAQEAVSNAELDARVTSPLQRTDSAGVFINPSQAPSQPTAPSPKDQSSAVSSTLTSQALTVSQVASSLQTNLQNSGSQTTSIHLIPLLGVAPLGPVPLGKDNVYQLTMIEAAFHHLPHPSDSERLRHYLPRNPCPTPSYYQQVPPPHADSVDFFQKLSTETLFFIFYYMEGTKAQYLAAKALKKQSWRFHTKYMMWFQRHEEPKSITEDYEQGTYIYFDYEKWGQRKKEGFTFEYRYLEDRDLN